MITQVVRKVGNSLVITIPKAESERLEIKEGDTVTVDLNKMELRPVLNPELHQLLESDLPTLEPMLNYLKDR